MRRDAMVLAVILGVLLGAVGCGGAPAPASAPVPASGSASAPASAAAADSAPPPASPPAPASAASSTSTTGAAITGGMVMIGDIVSPPKFDPKPALVAAKGDFVACYNQARRGNAGLHGKLNLQITVNETAAVTHVDGLGPAADPTLVACLTDALKQVQFPKPPGVAIITAPLVFRP